MSELSEAYEQSVLLFLNALLDNNIDFTVIVENKDIWEPSIDINPKDDLLSIEVASDTLESTHIDDDNLVIKTGFNRDGIEYTTTLEPLEILAILNPTDKVPYVLNPNYKETTDV